MLILTRQKNEAITITTPTGDVILVTVVDRKAGRSGDRVRLGFSAPRSVQINRTEVQAAIDKDRHEVLRGVYSARVVGSVIIHQFDDVTPTEAATRAVELDMGPTAGQWGVTVWGRVMDEKIITQHKVLRTLETKVVPMPVAPTTPPDQVYATTHDPAKCPHGDDPAECDACFRDSDEAYDSAREGRTFGRS